MRSSRLGNCLTNALTIALFAPLFTFAQLKPQGAHVLMFFPHLADGGTGAAKWQTTFTFINPNPSSNANVDLFTYGDTGSDLTMDLGMGLSSHQQFTVAASGTRVLRSAVTSQTTVQGWAVATSSVPIQAIAAYRFYVNGAPVQEMSTLPTLPTMRYVSPANKYSGVAIANPSSSSINVSLTVTDSQGHAVGSLPVQVPPLGHTAFILSQSIANLPDYTGTLTIRANNPPSNQFLAWTLGSDALGIWSSLPPGAYSWPVSHWERIWLVYLDVLDAVSQNTILPLQSRPRLQILTGQEVNAWANSNGTVAVSLGLSQLISDSPSELAYVIGHELGHILQFQNNRLIFWPSNYELDADVWGAFIAIVAGYDPYGAMGALGKLTVASGGAGIIKQMFDNLLDPHTSFSSRMDNVYSVLSLACNSSQSAKQICDEYKGVVHPNFPPGIVLGPATQGP